MITVKTILLADLIYSAGSLVLYAVALLLYGLWKKRRVVEKPTEESISVHCYHCADCHRPTRPSLKTSGAVVLCIMGGHLCEPCASRHHDEAS